MTTLAEAIDDYGSLAKYDAAQQRRFDVSNHEMRHEEELAERERERRDELIRDHVLHELTLTQDRPFYGKLKFRPGCGCWICDEAGLGGRFEWRNGKGPETDFDPREKR